MWISTHSWDASIFFFFAVLPCEKEGNFREKKEILGAEGAPKKREFSAEGANFQDFERKIEGNRAPPALAGKFSPLRGKMWNFALEYYIFYVEKTPPEGRQKFWGTKVLYIAKPLKTTLVQSLSYRQNRESCHLTALVPPPPPARTVRLR